MKFDEKEFLTQCNIADKLWNKWEIENSIEDFPTLLKDKPTFRKNSYFNEPTLPEVKVKPTFREDSFFNEPVYPTLPKTKPKNEYWQNYRSRIKYPDLLNKLVKIY